MNGIGRIREFDLFVGGPEHTDQLLDGSTITWNRTNGFLNF
jgi:hypothetical protein